MGTDGATRNAIVDEGCEIGVLNEGEKSTRCIIVLSCAVIALPANQSAIFHVYVMSSL